MCVCAHKLVSVKPETILMPCFRNNRVKIYRLEILSKQAFKIYINYMRHSVSYRILGDYGGKEKCINLVSVRHLLVTKLKLEKKKNTDLNLDLKVDLKSQCTHTVRSQTI